MSSPVPFGPIAELLERGGRAPDRTRKNGAAESPLDKDGRPEAQGTGGGGGVRMAPVGALEIGPQGTRFIHFHPLTPWLAAGGLGLVVGWLLARRR